MSTPLIGNMSCNVSGANARQVNINVPADLTIDLSKDNIVISSNYTDNTRRFTKTHNEIDWLFPTPVDGRNAEVAERLFDEYEEYAEDLFNARYKNGESTFSKADVIDAFMKGASVAHQCITSDVRPLFLRNHPWFADK